MTLLLMTYLVPIFYQLVTFSFKPLIQNQDGLNDAAAKSFIFATVSTVLNLTVSLVIAIRLRKIPLFSVKGKYLAFLLIPVLLGNVSVAFVGKLLFAQHAFFHQNVWLKWATLLLVQFWQFGTMFIYLFWLNLQGIPKAFWEYASSIRLNPSEQTKDIMLPSCRNLAMLLFMTHFIFAWHEQVKIDFIFKASRGTHTELISHWLHRTFQSDSLLSPMIAIQNTLQMSLLILGLSLILIFVVTACFYGAYQFYIKNRRPSFLTHSVAWHQIYWFGLLLFVWVPISYVIGHTVIHLEIQIAHLWKPALFTGIAAFVATLFSIGMGILWRVGWRDWLYTLNERSILFFIFLFLIQLIAPIALILTGFHWLKQIGYQNEWFLYGVWMLGHLFLVFPLSSTFILVTHFRTTNTELNYLDAHQMSFTEMVRDSFVKRFFVDYILTFLITFSLIWNEGSINSTLSDFIPSFISEMKMSLTGRGADYAKGMSYLLLSIAIAVTALFSWKIILDQIEKNEVNQI